MREVRIGVDLDSNNRFQMLKTYFNAKQFGQVDVYKTRHGFHVRIHRQVGLAENLQIRRLLGDDAERLGWDEIKLLIGLDDWVDTLFNEKMGSDGQIGKEELINPLSEAFLTKYTPKRRR